MAEYSITKVLASDRRFLRQVEELLLAEGIRKDGNLDYTCAVLDEDMNVIATGSCFGNTLRCMAVSSAHQGEGLMNLVVSHLMEVQMERGNAHLFLYTKCSSAKFFQDLGFYEIVRVENQIVFMENRRNGFADYLEALKRETAKQKARMRGENASMSTDAALPKKTTMAEGTPPTLITPRVAEAAVVMNANPFTLGHQYLVEQAAKSCNVLHLFMVSEDASLTPFSVRKRLIVEGTAQFPNIVYHESGPYIISSATFPSYFQKDASAVIESHARLDLLVFTKIAAALGISCRFVGEEPKSLVTGIYNEIMCEELPKAHIDCKVIARKTLDGEPISASDVRMAIHDGDWERLKKLVPETTSSYFQSPEAEPVIQKIRKAQNVVHY